MATWFRKIDVRMWGDGRFRALSAPQPTARDLWVCLLAGPDTTGLPGLYCTSEESLGRALGGWPLTDLRRAWDEIQALEMATADWQTGVVWIPNAVFYNEPDNPNTVLGWGKLFDAVPECPLKWLWLRTFAVYLLDRQASFRLAFLSGFVLNNLRPFDKLPGNLVEAFPEAFGKPLPEPWPQGSGNRSGNLGGKVSPTLAARLAAGFGELFGPGFREQKPNSNSIPISIPKKRGVRRGDAPTPPPLFPGSPEGEDPEPGGDAWDLLAAGLERDATEAGIPDAPKLVGEYLRALVEAVERFYVATGGSFTRKRRARVGATLSKFPLDVTLGAIEVFVDAHAGAKDERYLLGIARGFSRLHPNELEREIGKHRQRFKGRGLFNE